MDLAQEIESASSSITDLFYIDPLDEIFQDWAERFENASPDQEFIFLNGVTRMVSDTIRELYFKAKDHLYEQRLPSAELNQEARGFLAGILNQLPSTPYQ